MLLWCAWLVVGAAPFSGSLAASTCTNQSFCMGGTHRAPPSHCHALCARKPARTIVSRFFQFKRRCTRLPTSKRCISATLPALHFQPPQPELVDTSCCAASNSPRRQPGTYRACSATSFGIWPRTKTRNAAPYARRREQPDINTVEQQGETR